MSDRLPLVRGGQGRTGSELVATAVDVVLAVLAIAFVLWLGGVS